MKATFSNFAIALILLLPTPAYSAGWVEVEESGATVEEAKQNCFRSAIRNVVGQLIVSDTEVSGDAVTKDFIGDYSAGYVNDYEIQETYYENNKVTLHMQVNVASSKIAERMRTNSNHKTILDGDKLDTKVETILDQRYKGDRLLATVLSSYPHNAYILNGGATSAVIGVRRQIYIDIPYEIRWSRHWLDALVESLGEVSLESKSCKSFASKELEQLSLAVNAYRFFQDKICGRDPDISVIRKNPQDWLVKRSTFYFPDLSMLDIINSDLRNPIGAQHIGLVVELKEANGSIVNTKCATIPTDSLLEYTRHNREVDSVHGYNPRPKINGDISIAGTVRIDTKDVKLSKVSRVDMHLERTCN